MVLIACLVIAITLIGLVGWPMMSATISAEGTDSWEAVSRSYSYVFQAPWHYIWYAFVALVYGAVIVFFVGFMGSLTVYLSKWSISQTPFVKTVGREPSYLFVYAPESYQWRVLLLKGGVVGNQPLVNEVKKEDGRTEFKISKAAYRHLLGKEAWFIPDSTLDSFRREGMPEAILSKLKDEEFETRDKLSSKLESILTKEELDRWREPVLNGAVKDNYQGKDKMEWYNHVGAGMVAVWITLVLLLVIGFGYSYFWTAGTIIYLLMRQKVDDAEIDEIYLEEEEQPKLPRDEDVKDSGKGIEEGEQPKAPPETPAPASQPSSSSTLATGEAPAQKPATTESSAPPPAPAQTPPPSGDGDHPAGS